jgi:lysophospholipase L1-like esterase
VPRAVLGRPAAPTPAIGAITDSNGYGFGETNPAYTPDTTGAYGLIRRGLEAVNGHAIPYIIDGRGGDQIKDMLPANNPRQWEMMQYTTHGLLMGGTNSVPTETLAAMESEFTTEAQAAKGRVLRGKVYAFTIPPRTDSTNANVVSGYEPGAKPDQFNAWLISQIGVTFDGILDPNTGRYYTSPTAYTQVTTGVKDPATGRWLDSSYTTDGTHYSVTGSNLAAAVVKAWALTLH